MQPRNPNHDSNPPTTDRFAKYDDNKWSITFKDCYLTWLKSEKVPIRRFLVTTLLIALASAVAAAWCDAPQLAYYTIAALTVFTMGLAVYLHTLEERKSQTKPGHDSRGKGAD